MKQIIPINVTGGGVSRTIYSHYYKSGWHDFDPTSSIPHTAILEIEMEEARPIQVAQIYDKKENPMNGRVYSQDRTDPTLRTPTGGLSEQKIMEPCIIGYSSDHKGNVQSYHEKNCANTIHTHTGNGGNTDQFVKEMVIGSKRQKNIEYKLMQNGNIRAFDASTHDKRGISELQIINPDNECCTITTAHEPKVLIHYRIRKLTERECFRLMGMDDADIDKIDAYRIKTTLKNGTVKEKPIPKTQKYKMAGNSIVVDVLYHIFYQMFIAEPPKPQPKQLTLFDL